MRKYRRIVAICLCGIIVVCAAVWLAMVQILKTAANQGVPEAQTLLGTIYLIGIGMPQDYAKAAQWYQKAAEQGLAAAQHGLGVAYAEGTGVPKDTAKAAQWLQRAAEQGMPEAQRDLGMMYLLGVGVTRDAVKAEQWLQQAVKQGRPEAQLMIGVMYIMGMGVPRDRQRGCNLVRAIDARGDKQLEGRIKSYIERCDAGDIDIPQDVQQRLADDLLRELKEMFDPGK